jgi:hypothetical protein
MPRQDSAEFRGDASANAAGVHEIAAVIVPNQERIERVAVGDVAAQFMLQSLRCVL